ncbi:DNA repair protein RAD51 homolog 2 isoform X2 [Magnolia sinica]|uniref:DNA repair protein RAD51 homolog 2 isoform X2 n=1 Tax=Magnolia sinica TaxID=86752 RepID=UPI002659CFA5|nr:DNA repair protein RAD51 homolog 2 isoform X2 [Magnolia sinica]
MASKLISQMGLPQSIANVFAARNIQTAKDALSYTEFELMELLDVGLAEVTSAVAQISEVTCPSYQTALLLMEDRLHNGYLVGHLSTRLKGVDDALCGGIPSGALTELVGPAGIGKTQFCLKLALAAALPVCNGGLNGRVIYIDTESKFSSTRMIEIGKNSYPELFRMEGKAQEMAGRIVVLRPASLSEFTEREYERDTRAPRKNSLGWHISFLKSLAEFSQIPIVVTNQVRAQSSDVAHYPFEVHNMDQTVKNHEHLESHLVAALGIHWAHAVNIRLVLEAHSDQRFIKVAKSPCSPPKAFPFVVTSGGISLLSDEGIEVMGPEINTIRCQGYDNLVRGERW